MLRRILQVAPIILLLLAGTAAYGQQQQDSMFKISGVTYTKWLWGTQRYDGSLYNFTTVPGEGSGDNGQGTELELLVSGRPNKYIEVSGRIHSRFSQNFWTNFGGFGGSKSADCGNLNGGGDCGEFDQRSNQYVKLRGMTVRITPGYQYVDAITFGSSDLGMFDPFTIGKIRYIDRDNAGMVMVQGGFSPNFRYDAMRLSLPRLWAGPNFETGQYASQDGAYAMQFKWNQSSMFDLAGIADIVRDVEVNASDKNLDDGRSLSTRYSNDVFGVRFGIHPSGTYDIRGAYYYSNSDPNAALTGRTNEGISQFSPVPSSNMSDKSWKLNFDINDPFQNGVSFNFEAFDIGAKYVSVLAARRESDVLLTEGHDGTYATTGPSNARYGVFGGNPSVIGFAGWQGNMQQVATINVDNEFTDFDEPAAETVIGWKGFTFVPRWQTGTAELSGEYTHIGYNTNWQLWGNPALYTVDSSPFPGMEGDTGVGHPYRTAYAPFQDKKTDIALIKGKYTIPYEKGIDLFGKVKWINETDKRLNNPAYLPYKAGDCPGGGAECKNVVNNYATGLNTSGRYTNPPVITVNGVTGYQWKPFDSISDDDRNLDYKMLQIGAGYQFSDIVYSSLAYERYAADLEDGNTAFQAYNLHEMASGNHDKNKVILLVKYPIGGVEAGLDYEYAWGSFKPDFGGGFVPQVATAAIAADHNVKVGSLGFSGRYGGWNSLEKRDFKQNHLKAYFKVRF